MYKYDFTPQAEKDIQKLPHNIAVKIINKLEFYISTGQTLSFAERLINSDIGQYRFRIGDYRVIFDLDQETITILTIGYRKEIYK